MANELIDIPVFVRSPKSSNVELGYPPDGETHPWTNPGTFRFPPDGILEEGHHQKKQVHR